MSTCDQWNIYAQIILNIVHRPYVRHQWIGAHRQSEG